MAEPQIKDAVTAEPVPMSEELRDELSRLTSTDRSAVIMLLLGEQQAADIIRFLNPREVQALGSAMVGVADLSQEAVKVLTQQYVPVDNTFVYNGIASVGGVYRL